MIFTTACPACESEFPIDSAKVPEGGVYARCSKCSDVFLVEVPEEPTPVAEAATEEAVTPTEESALEAGSAEPAEETDEVPAGDPDAAEAKIEEDEPAGDASFEPPAADVSPADTSQPRVDDGPLSEQPAPADHTATVAAEIVEEAAAPEPVVEETVAQPAAAEPTTPAPAPSAPVFGKRDPNERAARLARVLVSDMIAYHPDRHRRSLEEGTLKEEFDDEIQKSWNEYVDQVGQELAETTPYFRDALNQVLARGQELF